VDGIQAVEEDAKLNTHVPDFPDASLDKAVDAYHAICDSIIEKHMKGESALRREIYHLGYMHAVTQVLRKYRRQPTKCSGCDGALVDGKCRFVNHREETI
jgi:hypothetical protein